MQVCLPVPLFHCFGCVLGALAITSHGACIVLPGEGFDPQQTLEAVQQEHCTALYGVPTMFIAELALPEFDQYDLSSLRKGIMAGSPCPQEIMEKVEAISLIAHMDIILLSVAVYSCLPPLLHTCFCQEHEF